MSRAELCMRAANYVQVVVAAFADSACQAVREGVWEAERVRFEMNALSQGGFVRRLIVGAYYDLDLRDAWGSFETYLEEVTSNLKQSEHWLRCLENLREAAELQRASRGSATTAKNVTWDDVIVAFTSDERVQISAKVGGGTFNYTEFGLEDRRDGTPREAWTTLRELAEGDGFLMYPKDARALLKLEKRVGEIRKIFRKRFGVESDPVPVVEGVGYRSAFKIGRRPSYET